MFGRKLETYSEKETLGLVFLGPIFGLLYILFLPIIGIMTLLLALPEFASAKKAPLIESAEVCMSCHSVKGMDKKFRNTEKMSVYVDLNEFSGSAHSSLSCDGCHAGISPDTHPGDAKTYDSKRAFVLSASKACSNCHSNDKLKAKPHHSSMMNRSNAPPCIECHGAHSVKKISSWKSSLAENKYCLTCHNLDMNKTHLNGESLSLHIEQAQLSASVHNRHACKDCHTEFSMAEHPMKSFKSGREHSVLISDACRRCHEEKYSAVRQSIHYSLVSEGDLNAPVCTDCHGFHSVGPKATYETMSGVPCRNCHEEIFKSYSQSVHGTAKAKGEHRAPLCSSCHSAHDVKVADMTEKIRNACLGCHKGIEFAHEKWLPNSSLHLSAVGCAACHSPKASRGISLRLYDQNTGKPFTEEQIIKLLGPDYEGLSERMSAHGNGIDSGGLWHIVKELNRKGAEARVTFLGKMEASRGSGAHMLSLKKDAVKDCESCHTAGSDFFKTVTVAIVRADGRMKEYKANPDVLGSMISVAALKQFYVLGSTRLKILDWIGILMVFGGMSVPVAHITLRILTTPIREAKRMNKFRKGDRR
jgi:predicted CXXCH cytochrome family protein